jgi:uncharacterized protein (UPF0276 family)
MQFALNYSPQAAALLAEGKIAIDRFKCPNWPDLVAHAQALHPVYVHFDLIAGGGKLDRVDWAQIETLLAQTGTACVNLHLMVPAGKQLSPDSKAYELRQTAHMAQMIADVTEFTWRFGAERVIVENVPYRGTEGKYDPICVQPEVFHHLLNETGAGLLLDISHARISAGSLGVDERAYIEAMPLHRLRELHVTGLREIDGVPTDHLEMGEGDWVMFDWMLDKIRAGSAARPLMVSFEYGGVSSKFEWRSKPEVIAAQVPRLYAAVHGAA